MKYLFLILAIFASSAVLAEPVNLISYSEMVQSNDNKSAYKPKFAPVPGAPNIDLVTPKLEGAIVSPTPIRMRFEAKSPSTIKPDTFKVYYGSFQIDITERLLGASKVGSNGFSIQEAALPKGSHKLTLNIQDSEGRVGSKIVEFEVK
jgi:hypothetical protein